MKKINDRLRFIIEYYKTTQADFAESIGTTPATLSRQLKGLHKIDKQVALSVQAVYRINCNWLLSGEGDMFLSDSDEIFGLSLQEIKVIKAYREKENMQQAVNLLLGIDDEITEINQKFNVS